VNGIAWSVYIGTSHARKPLYRRGACISDNRAAKELYTANGSEVVRVKRKVCRSGSFVTSENLLIPLNDSDDKEV
jgi:hypothetical protein